jgi:hypothetical protein
MLLVQRFMIWWRHLFAGEQQEQLALEVGFEYARHYELAFGLMGCLVAENEHEPM